MFFIHLNILIYVRKSVIFTEINFCMKKIIVALALVLSFSTNYSQERKTDTYYFSVDLTNVVDDKLGVKLLAPAINSDEIIYRLPKIVPGTYEIYDFGRFVSSFTAYDKSGKEITVTKKDENSWVIKNAKTLDKISYFVEDTWDTQIKEKFVFEPGGTNIEAGTNFVLNNHGFFGYFDNMRNYKYEVTVTKPKGFYGATALIPTKTDSVSDTFTTKNYFDLADSPIMYSLPDTAIIRVGGAQVLVALYSPNHKVDAKFLANNIREVLKAQKEYLGGKLPIEKYAFIIYLTAVDGGSGANGALEHNYSSFYFMPEINGSALAQYIKDVAAHEFFHIVTPLSIHSEEIGNFDFDNPNMSMHLWLYEGVTEYFAGHVQVRYGLLENQEYLSVLRDKMKGADQYNDTLPFTKMSLGCLDTYNSQYGNVYQKGALIAMCIDIKLLYLSGGKYGLINLLTDLSKTYGKDKSFDDDSLFIQIAKISYPEIGEFLERYVNGNLALPLKETLALVGIDYVPKISTTGYSYGNVDIGYNPDTKRLVIVNTYKMDDIGKELGFAEGDELLKFNGKKVNPDNIEDVIQSFFLKAKDGQSLKVTVIRTDENGKAKKIKMKTKVREVEIVRKHFLQLSKTATDKQIVLRKLWLGPIELK